MGNIQVELWRGPNRFWTSVLNGLHGIKKYLGLLTWTGNQTAESTAMKNSFVVCLLLLFVAATAFGDTGLYNTGVSSSGWLTEGAVDPDYILTSIPGGSGPQSLVVIANQSPIPPWVGSDGISQWIGSRADANNGSGVGNFDYQITFYVYSLANAVVAGQMASDNASEIYLDSTDTGQGVPYQFGSEYSFDHWTSFNISSGFHTGLNTLDFVVNNADCNGCANPTGLRVEYTEVPPVPEPASVFLLGTMLLGLSGLLKRGLTH